jgi:hypothetical protein
MRQSAWVQISALRVDTNLETDRCGHHMRQSAWVQISALRVDTDLENLHF